MELLEMHWMDEFQVNYSHGKTARNLKVLEIWAVWKLELKYI